MCKSCPTLFSSYHSVGRAFKIFFFSFSGQLRGPSVKHIRCVSMVIGEQMQEYTPHIDWMSDHFMMKKFTILEVLENYIRSFGIVIDSEPIIFRKKNYQKVNGGKTKRVIGKFAWSNRSVRRSVPRPSWRLQTRWMARHIPNRCTFNNTQIMKYFVNIILFIFANFQNRVYMHKVIHWLSS